MLDEGGRRVFLVSSFGMTLVSIRTFANHFSKVSERAAYHVAVGRATSEILKGFLNRKAKVAPFSKALAL